MSEFTDDMLEGLYCMDCGECLYDFSGYPRRCSDCEEKAKKEKKDTTTNPA